MIELTVNVVRNIDIHAYRTTKTMLADTRLRKLLLFFKTTIRFATYGSLEKYYLRDK